MQRYGAYKDSGVEWIGEIPEGWHTDILFRAARILGSGCTPSTDVESNYDGDIPWLQVCDLGKGRVASASKCISEWALSKHSVLSMYSAPFLAIAMYASIGSISFVQRDSCVNQAICAISAGQLELRYLYYALKCAGPSMLADGVGGTQKNISQQYLRKIKLPVPSFDEQQAIADSLDGKTAEIDSIISQTERSIELLREYRKSVISEAVTKGLDPDAPMKDSGVEWIGEIPAGWSLVKLGVVATKIGSGKTPRGGANVYHDEGITFLRSQNIYDTGLRLDDVAYISEEVDEEMSATRVFKGDVLLNITGGSIGRCCTYDLEAHANVNQHVCIIRPSGKALPKWIRYFWNSNPGRTTVDIHQSGANREGLNFEQIASARIPLPSVNEQTKIVLYIDAKTAEIDSLIADKQRQVELLREYRKSLISEAVTGKFKVPGLE